MNTIKNYVETMFMNLPDTVELKELQEDILVNMEEKYQELIETGVSENEAVGLVISEFGNIDEIMNELSIDQEKEEEVTTTPNLTTLSIDDIDSYVAMKRTTSVGIGMGVICCGIAASLIVAGVYFNSVILGVILSLFLIVAAVGLFIVNGLKHNAYDYLEKGFFVSNKNINYIKNEEKQFEKSFVLSLIIGVGLCIISAIPVLVGSQDGDRILLYVCGTIITATIGCFFIIYGGMVKSAYGFLLENGFDSSLSEKDLAKKIYWKKFNDNFWLVIVAIYLLISFVFGIWELSWLIFPVAGVLSGIWMNEKR